MGLFKNIKGIMQYAFLCIWLFFFFPISTIPDIFLCRLIESYLILFNEVMCHVPRHGCIIFFKNHFPIDRYLGSFHFFLSLKSTAINILANVSLCARGSSSLESEPRSGIAGLKG